VTALPVFGGKFAPRKRWVTSRPREIAIKTGDFSDFNWRFKPKSEICEICGKYRVLKIRIQQTKTDFTNKKAVGFSSNSQQKCDWKVDVTQIQATKNGMNRTSWMTTNKQNKQAT